ncbi:SDR family oxidoreductase [Candidatus Protochlamydia phocaeensis]|uniref:SDR family oxidoreductase n=1 Tax=Candidatus Protochlamydia phocaeensis TaxID=1414722 RepID=UPI000837F4E4|nr:SDR family oxidoreductase [Candidatus Protochlamydia phocaeensis]
MDKVLITGASGHLGRALIHFLLERKPPSEIVALVKDVSKGQDFTSKGVQFRIGDYFDYSSLLKAFKGMDKVVLISSSNLKDRIKQHSHVIEAAKEAGVRHVLYTSLIHLEPEEPPDTILEKGHRETEAYLESSGLAYTIFRNGMYFDMILNLIGKEALHKTKLRIPAKNGKSSFTDRKDIAKGMARVIAERGHEHAIYNMTSPVSYSFLDIAHALSSLAGRHIDYMDISEDLFKADLLTQQKTQEDIERALALAEMIRDNKCNCPDTRLETFLGRKPLSLMQFLQSVDWR